MFFKKAAVLGLAVAGAYGAQIQKRDGAHGHAHAAAAPASGYGAPAPATGYGAPDTSYAAPDTGYGAPDAGYAAPDTGYGAPDTGYEAAPAYGADDAAVGPGILPFVAVILAIIGLSLLFPAVVNVESRRKRSLAEAHTQGPFAMRVTRDLPAYPKVNRDSGYGAPQAPAEGYAAPAPSYSAPAPSYSAPEPAYEAPDTGYGAPAASYGAPSYDAAPSYGAEEEAGLDLTSILIPILALLGLSLLFPTYVAVSTRKKRSLDGTESNPVYDLAERVQDMYSAVLRSESCMEKIVCELGGMAKDLTASPVTGLVEPFVPTKYSNMYKTFKNGKDCHKIKC